MFTNSNCSSAWYGVKGNRLPLRLLSFLEETKMTGRGLEKGPLLVLPAHWFRDHDFFSRLAVGPWRGRSFRRHRDIDSIKPQRSVYPSRSFLIWNGKPKERVPFLFFQGNLPDLQGYPSCENLTQMLARPVSMLTRQPCYHKSDGSHEEIIISWEVEVSRILWIHTSI